MKGIRITAVIFLLLGALTGYFIYSSEQGDSAFPFRYGLDLDGGTHLTYRADTSHLEKGDVDGAMSALRQTIERRVNGLGVSEAIVLVEEGGIFSDEENQNRLIVELPGVTDVQAAIDAIGETPLLEFRLAGDDITPLEELNASSTPEEFLAALNKAYLPTGLDGGDLKRSQIVFDPVTNQPVVSIQFNKEGTDLFQTITRDNVGSVLAIFLDGQIISSPVIQQEIAGGQAQITGQFTAEQARDLAQSLNLGALPVDINLIETQTIGPSLGAETLQKGISALIYAFIAVFIFLVLYYRIPGLVATVVLVIYGLITLLFFKIIPVTLTSSGVAGFILSMGMAVDANILIFERMKEELRERGNLRESIREGFNRAWPSIRDGNLSSLISAVVLYWLSGTAVVKGFAFVLGIGILVSVFTSMVVSRVLMLAISFEHTSKLVRTLFSCGFTNADPTHNHTHK